MQRLRLLSILLLTSLLISSCAPSEPGRYAHVTLGPDYPHGVGIRVLLLPVNVEGDPARLEDRAATEAMGQRLMEIGYRVIDWEQAKSRAAAAGVNLHSANEADVMRVARDLGVDALGKGLVVMGHSAGRSESGVKFETVKRTEIRNGTHRKDTVIIKEEVPTPYSYSSESSYYVASQRLSLVSVQSGELLLSAAVDRGSYDMDEELAWGIRRAVSGK